MKANLVNKDLIIKNEVFERNDIVEIVYGAIDRRKIIKGRIIAFMQTSEGDILINIDISTLYHSDTQIVIMDDVVKIRKA